MPQQRQRWIAEATKRGFDVLLSGGALVLLAPLLVLIGIFVRVKLGCPVLFVQQRPGRWGKPFLLYKFRTMTDAKNAEGALLGDKERLTPFGQFLRSTSMDELPELWNVLKGDMSLVGPRPLLTCYLERYSPEQARRHEVRPGITGWAQINGRNALSWEEKFSLDVWYVDHWSIALDFRIIIRTFLYVLQRRGISSNEHVTMPEFLGKADKS